MSLFTARFLFLLVFVPSFLYGNNSNGGDDPGNIMLIFQFLKDSVFRAKEVYPVIFSSEVDKALFILPKTGCYIASDRFEVKDLVGSKEFNAYKADRETLEDLIDSCQKYQNDEINATEFVSLLREKAFFIYPGTKWCGAGDNADNYTDLGTSVETDKCCRAHDLCKDYIEGQKCHPVHGLCNNTPFTRSHCKCDERFRQCLLQANETTSSRVGTLYFTVFGLKCFRKDYPIIKCMEYGGFLNIHCQQYALDTEAQKRYQFFDTPKFVKETPVPDKDM